IHSFEMVLGINPDNKTAMMSLESLRSIMASVAPAPADDQIEAAEIDEPEVHEPIEARVADIRYFGEEEASHYSPTQELVFPVEAAYLKEANDDADEVSAEFESVDVVEEVTDEAAVDEDEKAAVDFAE